MTTNGTASAPYLPTLPSTAFRACPSDAIVPTTQPTIAGLNWTMVGTFGHGELEELVWRMLVILEQAGNGWQAISVQDLLTALAEEATRTVTSGRDIVAGTLLALGRTTLDDMYNQIAYMIERGELGHFTEDVPEGYLHFVYITQALAEQIEAFRR